MTDVDLRDLVLGAEFPDELYDFTVVVARKLLRLRKDEPNDRASELAHDTFLDVGFEAFQQAAHGAGSDIEFRGWIKTVVRNTRNSHLEKDPTTASRILISIRKALSEASDRFVRMGRRWCLRGHNHGYDLPETDVLRQAAAGVNVAVVTQDATEGRNAPIASRDDQRALCTAILEAAGGCLDRTDLGRIVADRVGVPFGIIDVEIDGANHASGDDLDEFFDRVTVDLLFDQLNDDEIELLRDLTLRQLGIRDAAAARGWKKHRMETVRKRLTLKLQHLAELHGVPDTAAILTRLEENSGQDPHLDGSELTHD